MKNTMKTDIILISYNTQNLLLKCLNSLYRVPQGCELGNVIVVDNCSDDKTVENVRENFPEVFLIEMEKNIGYAAAVNRGMAAAQTEWVFVGNADIEFRHNTLLSLYESIAEFPGTAVACPQQVYPDNSRERSWGHFPGIGEALHYASFTSAIEGMLQSLAIKLGINRKAHTIPYADGAALLLHKQTFNSIGGFDEEFFFFGEEADFCYRIWQADHIVLFVPSAVIMHVRGASYGGNSPSMRSLQMLAESKIHFIKKNRKSQGIAITLMIMLWYYILLLFINSFPALFSSSRRAAWRTCLMNISVYSSLIKQYIF